MDGILKGQSYNQLYLHDRFNIEYSYIEDTKQADKHAITCLFFYLSHICQKFW